MLVQSRDSASAYPATGRPPVRVAICGEVNSGKSTVMNAILRSRLLPDNIGQSERPLIRAQFRDEPGAQVRFPDGRVEEYDQIDDPKKLHGAAEVRLWSDKPQIVGFEFVEIPMTNADEVTEDDKAVMKEADVLIWVTIASQAWRLTEKSIVARFDDVLPEHRLIVVSRADKLRSKSDRKKLRSRVERETTDQFDACVFLHGANRTIDASEESQGDWHKSGGVEILSKLHGFMGTDMGDLSEDTSEPVENLFDFVSYRNEAAEADAKAEALEKPKKPARTLADEPVINPARVAISAAIAGGLSPAPGDPPQASPDVVDNLSRIARRRLPVGSIVGLFSGDEDGTCEVLMGDEARCLSAGEALQGFVAQLNASYQENGFETEPEALMMANANWRVACEYLPGTGTVFMVVDAERLNLGGIKSLMIQMRCAAALTM